MFPIDMEEPQDMAVAPSAWQALETAWLGMSARTALAHTRRDVGKAGTCRPNAMAVRRITGIASLRRHPNER